MQYAINSIGGKIVCLHKTLHIMELFRIFDGIRKYS